MSAFERLVKIIRYDLANDGRTDDPIPEVQLQVSVKPNHVVVRLKLGEEDSDDFIPGVHIQTASTVDGGDLDELAERLLDDLAKRALRVGRLDSEPSIRPARRRSA